MKTLLELNRFNHITFHEEEHRYTIGERELRSVTQIVSDFKEPFDKEGNAERVAKKRGVSIEAILDEWELKRDISCEKGTLFHQYVEHFLANKAFVYPEEEVLTKFGEDPIQAYWPSLVSMFEQFHRDSSRSLVPVRSEFVVGDEELGIGGMVDQIFFNRKSGQLEIWDWKTNKAIGKSSPFGKRLLAPLDHLDECEWHTYSLQLALYKHLIEKNTQLQFGHSYIAWFHEKNETYKVFRCAPFVSEIKVMLEQVTQYTQESA